MADRVVPMIHVPDVRATVDWYHAIGFTVDDTYDNGAGGLSFAILSFGSSQVMLNQGGQPSTRARREVDLYVYTAHVDDMYSRLRDRVDVVEEPHETFYGMREFILRDLNRFWLTFAQAKVPEMTSAVPTPDVDAGTLQSYVGEYESGEGLKLSVIVKGGTLFVALGGQQPLNTVAVDKTTFRPAALDGGTVTFDIGPGTAMDCTFTMGRNATQLKRVKDTGRP